jgi:hypothetical protein
VLWSEIGIRLLFEGAGFIFGVIKEKAGTIDPALLQLSFD